MRNSWAKAGIFGVVGLGERPLRCASSVVSMASLTASLIAVSTEKLHICLLMRTLWDCVMGVNCVSVGEIDAWGPTRYIQGIK